MYTSPLIILGSARKKSDTARFVAALFQDQEYRLIDLLEHNIAPYSYAHEYPEGDDFMKLSGQMLQHRLIIFATPVYWYAMSGPMKTFFDRLTDLTNMHKETGRKLRGRQTALLTVGTDEELPPGFTVPFASTSRYLGMDFTASAYAPRHQLEDADYIEQQRAAFMQNSGQLTK